MISENTYSGTKLLYKNKIVLLRYVYMYRKDKHDNVQYFAVIKKDGASLDVLLSELDYINKE